MKTEHLCILCGKPLKYEFEVEMNICEDCQLGFTKKTTPTEVTESESVEITEE